MPCVVREYCIGSGSTGFYSISLQRYRIEPRAMDPALVENIRREAFKSNGLTAKVPDFASTCKALCELLSQYPGGLSWAVILTSLASKQQVSSATAAWTVACTLGVPCTACHACTGDAGG